MKRINEKIQEIERKEKINQLLYIAFIAVVGGFMAYIFFTEKKIDRKNTEIKQKDSELLEADIKQTKTYQKLDSAYVQLQKSLSPEKYWQQIEKENSVEAYISFLTNNWGIGINTADKEKAIEKLFSSKVGTQDYQGWVWIGEMKDDNLISKSIVEVVYRKGEEPPYESIKKGDIVQLITSRNRNTYGNRTIRTGKNLHGKGWRNKTKAFVMDTYKEREKLISILRLNITKKKAFDV